MELAKPEQRAKDGFVLPCCCMPVSDLVRRDDVLLTNSLLASIVFIGLARSYPLFCLRLGSVGLDGNAILKEAFAATGYGLALILLVMGMEPTPNSQTGNQFPNQSLKSVVWRDRPQFSCGVAQ
jgi:hypothetical protein